MYAIFRHPRLGMVIVTVLLWTLEGGLVCAAWITLTRRTEERAKTSKTSKVQWRRAIRNRGPPAARDVPRRLLTVGTRLGIETDRERRGSRISLEGMIDAHRM